MYCRLSVGVVDGAGPSSINNNSGREGAVSIIMHEERTRCCPFLILSVCYCQLLGVIDGPLEAVGRGCWYIRGHGRSVLVNYNSWRDQSDTMMHAMSCCIVAYCILCVWYLCILKWNLASHGTLLIPTREEEELTLTNKFKKLGISRNVDCKLRAKFSTNF